MTISTNQEIIMISGKSIRIYLKEGTVSGSKLAEIVNLTIQALACPRNKLVDLNRYFSKGSNRPGIYFLFGTDDHTGETKVYIGEAENVWDRLKNHDTNKDFWNEVILFTSKDENLTKSHVKYLESRLIHIATRADVYILENSNSPSLNSLPLPDQDAMEEFIINTKLLTGALGHKFLENITAISETVDTQTPLTDPAHSYPITNSNDTLELELNVRGIRARGLQTDAGIVVLEGSEVSKNESEKYGYKTLRKKLIANKTIQLNDSDKLIFTKNHLFKNPSPAAAVIVGYSINGRRTWKNKEGKTLSQIEQLDIV